LLLARLSGLARLAAFLTLTLLALLPALLALPELTTLILVHVVCHQYSSIFAEHALPRAPRDLFGICKLVAVTGMPG
jgi:hypothetical protein